MNTKVIDRLILFLYISNLEAEELFGDLLSCEDFNNFSKDIFFSFCNYWQTDDD